MIHQESERGGLFLLRKDRNPPSSDDALVGIGTIPSLRKVLQFMPAVHLKGGPAVLLHESPLIPLQGAVKVKRDLPVFRELHPEIQGNDIGIAVIVQRDPTDIASPHDLRDLPDIPDLSVLPSHPFPPIPRSSVSPFAVR